jgi:hypothetical protein
MERIMMTDSLMYALKKLDAAQDELDRHIATFGYSWSWDEPMRPSERRADDLNRRYRGDLLKKVQGANQEVILAARALVRSEQGDEE